MTKQKRQQYMLQQYLFQQCLLQQYQLRQLHLPDQKKIQQAIYLFLHQDVPQQDFSEPLTEFHQQVTEIQQHVTEQEDVMVEVSEPHLPQLPPKKRPIPQEQAIPQEPPKKNQKSLKHLLTQQALFLQHIQ